MNNKRIILKEFRSSDIDVIKSVYEANIRAAIIGNKKNINIKKLKNFISKNNKYLRTIYSDNQRIGICIKNKSKFKFLLRYRYIRKFKYQDLKTKIKASF